MKELGEWSSAFELDLPVFQRINKKLFTFFLGLAGNERTSTFDEGTQNWCWNFWVAFCCGRDLHFLGVRKISFSAPKSRVTQECKSNPNWQWARSLRDRWTKKKEWRRRRETATHCINLIFAWWWSFRVDCRRGPSTLRLYRAISDVYDFSPSSLACTTRESRCANCTNFLISLLTPFPVFILRLLLLLLRCILPFPLLICLHEFHLNALCFFSLLLVRFPRRQFSCKRYFILVLWAYI